MLRSDYCLICYHRERKCDKCDDNFNKFEMYDVVKNLMAEVRNKALLDAVAETENSASIKEIKEKIKELMIL